MREAKQQLNDLDTVKRDGKVALRQIGNNQRAVPVNVDGVDYAASIQYNVWILWVDEAVAERILNSPKNLVQGCSCNNSSRKELFKYASPLDVSVFETGDRPR